MTDETPVTEAPAPAADKPRAPAKSSKPRKRTR